MTYHNDRDVELWISKGEGWSFPFKTYRGTHNGIEYVHLICAVPIGFAQSDVLKRYLTFLGGSHATNGWLLPTEALEKHFQKAGGLTPEFYYLWNGESSGKSSQTPYPGEADVADDDGVRNARRKSQNASGEEFLSHVALGSGLDKSTLILAWMAICQAIPGWLMSGKPLSFGFCRMYALPYRRNWKELLLARYPTLRKALMVKNAKRFLALAFTAASRMLRLTDLTEYRERRGRAIFAWNIEVLTDPEWDSICESAEVEAAASAGAVAYVRRWASKISQSEETIYEVLSSQIQKENAPTCRVFWRRGERHMRFAQASPTVISSCQIGDCDEGAGQSLDDFLGIEDSAQYLEEKASRLLAMSDVQPNEDVRLPRGDGDGLGGSGDDRMLVLPATGGEVAGEDVLDGQHGAKERLDQ